MDFITGKTELFDIIEQNQTNLSHLYPPPELVDQSNNAGAFDRDGEFFLVIQAIAGNAAGQDFALFSLEFHQSFGILEINVVDLGFAEPANFRLGRSTAAPSLSFLTLHGNTSYSFFMVC
jgi:hypothetical protein